MKILFDHAQMANINIRDHPFRKLAFFRGREVKNLPNLPMDINQKLQMVGVKNHENLPMSKEGEQCSTAVKK